MCIILHYHSIRSNCSQITITYIFSDVKFILKLFQWIYFILWLILTKIKLHCNEVKKCLIIVITYNKSVNFNRRLSLFIIVFSWTCCIKRVLKNIVIKYIYDKMPLLKLKLSNFRLLLTVTVRCVKSYLNPYC